MSHAPELTWILIGALIAALAIAVVAIHSGVDRERPALSHSLPRPDVGGPPRPAKPLPPLPPKRPVVLV